MDQMTFQALFEHSSLGIIISNEDGVIEKCNPYAARIFGYEPNELLGQMIEVLVPIPLQKNHIHYRQKYIDNPTARAMGSNLNLLAVKKDGEEFPVEISLTYYENEGQRQIVSFINDITERKQAENELRRMKEELESKVNERTKELSDALVELGHTTAQLREMWEREKELNELKSRFVSMASHEFRTPLGGILTSISLIAKYPNTEDEPKRAKHIQNIKKSVKNLTSILNDFLSLDKLEQGKIATNPVSFSFSELIAELVEDLQEVNEKKHQIVVESLEQLTLYQDKEMIRNVAINLISNAIKYSPAESSIFVRIQKSDQKMIFEVEDQGMGIPLEDQKHLFERFFRAKNAINLQGTGLGLNIVRRYLDLMGGKITYHSMENKGTTFTVTVPLEQK